MELDEWDEKEKESLRYVVRLLISPAHRSRAHHGHPGLGARCVPFGRQSASNTDRNTSSGRAVTRWALDPKHVLPNLGRLDLRGVWVRRAAQVVVLCKIDRSDPETKSVC